MKHILSCFVLFCAVFAQSGCALVQKPAQSDPPEAILQTEAEAPPEAGAETDAQAVGAQPPAARPKRPPASARTAEQFDTTSKADRAAAVEAATDTQGRLLGRSITSLGTPTEAGFWIKTPLAEARAKGRVSHPETGASVQVDLIPLDGEKTGGSRISLAAMRLLGVALTDLPELDIYLQ